MDRSNELHARARAFVSAFEAGAPSPEPFDALACDIARFQGAHIEGFARLSAARGVDLERVTSASQIPAVPTDAFKVTRVAAFEEGRAEITFKTSGTTAGARGAHEMRDVSTYDAAAIAFGRRWLARDLDRSVPVVVLGPSPSEAPDSSLVHMCASFAEAFGADAAPSYLVTLDGIIDLATFDERVAVALAKGEPMLVLGTSFAFVHLVDALGKASFALPPGSRVMQTGGYKGRSREVPPDVLRSDLSRAFGLDQRRIVAEYGMTELSSQFYERTLFDEDASFGWYAEPPWARVVPVDPVTLEPVADGEMGVARIVDLMNVDSAVVVLTQDQVRRSTNASEGFELIGRAPGAPPRGCSIAMDEILGRRATITG
ncbi:MAG: acyl-protein synthetase [Labilithrix sp.]|nr:acyl-protein synthetase [Labilithrix sp.]